MNVLGLIWGSFLHRPYVYAFLACFVAFAARHMGGRRMLLFMAPTYLVAYACEYSSTRNGFPFGPYRYFEETRSRELFLSNVPFFDSLSFVFLSYFSFVLAAALVGDASRPSSRAIPWLGGVLMMLLDLVIDPVALQGDKWFLGRIYEYPHTGFYFGVTAANFAGWFFVGLVTQALFQMLLGSFFGSRASPRPTTPLFLLGVYGVYAAVLLFNVTITIAIGDARLAIASGIVSTATLTAAALGLWRQGVAFAGASVGPTRRPIQEGRRG